MRKFNFSNIIKSKNTIKKMGENKNTKKSEDNKLKTNIKEIKLIKDGEKKIEQILKEMSINFDRKKKLMNLKKDAKKFRIPDFYLKDYDLIIEYFGSWHNTKNKAMEKRERSRFMEKVGAYEQSGINCLYLYPEDYEKFEEKIKKKISEIKIKGLELTSLIKKIEKKELEEKEVKTHIRPTKDQPIEKPQKDVKKLVEHIRPTKNTILTEKKITRKPIISERKNFDNSENYFLKKSILFLDGFGLILTFFMAIIFAILFLEGNPLVSELHPILDLLFLIFLIAIILSIILSAMFALQKELSKGFTYVSIILIVFFVILQWFFGSPLLNAIIILICAFGIIPSQYYMVNSN
jgi:very-short-patch-repair endonuclease